MLPNKPPDKWTPHEFWEYWMNISGQNQVASHGMVHVIDQLLKTSDAYDFIIHLRMCAHMDEYPDFMCGMEGRKLEHDPLNRYRYWASYSGEVKSLVEELEDRMNSFVVAYDNTEIIEKLEIATKRVADQAARQRTNKRTQA